MSNSLALDIACIATLWFTLKCVIFMMGDRRQATLKTALTDWWVRIEDGDWSLFLKDAARITERILTHFFGEGFFSLRYFFVSLVFGFLFLNTLDAAAMKPTGNIFTLLRDWMTSSGRFVLLVMPVSAALDACALGMARKFLREWISQAHAHPRVLFFQNFFCMYFTISTQITIGSIVKASEAHITFGTASYIWMFFLEIFSPLLLLRQELQALVAHGSMSLYVLLSIFAPPCFSVFVLMTVIAACGLVVLAKPLLRDPVGVVIERLAEAQKPLNMVVDGLTALAGFLAAWKDVVRHS